MKIRTIIFAIGVFFIGSALAVKHVNIDVKNLGGGPANNIEVFLNGNQNIIWHYDGYPSGPNMGVFANFSRTVAGGNTLLAWTNFADGVNNLVDVGQIVHIGWETSNNHTVRDMWWTMNGNRVEGSVVYVAKGTGIAVGTQYFARFENQCVPEGFPQRAILVRNLHYAILANPLPLSALNGQNTALMSQLQLIPGEFQVQPQSFFDVPLSRAPHGNETLVLVHEVDAPGTSGLVTVFSQDAPDSAPVPASNPYVLAILIMLGLAIGVYGVRRITAAG